VRGDFGQAAGPDRFLHLLSQDGQLVLADRPALAGTLHAADDLVPSLVDCSIPPVNAAASVGKVIDAPPTKVFDQLYYLGMNSVASWAIATSAGIIQIDSLDNTEEAQRVIIGGYKKLGLDPAQMKYLILTHGHNDHFGGAKYLQDTYHPHVLMSAVDWDMVAKLPPPQKWSKAQKRAPPSPRGVSVI